MEFKGSITAQRLKAFAQLVKAVSNEPPVVIGADGFSVLVTDEAHVMMLNAHLPTREFVTYEPGSGSRVTFDLERILALGGNGSVVQIQTKEGTTWFASAGEKFGVVNDADSIPAPRPPKLNPEEYVKCIVQREEFLEAITKINKFVGYIRLSGNENGMLLYGESEAVKAGDPVQTHRKVYSNGLEAHGKARSLFSIDYLRKMFNAIPYGAEVKLTIGADFPLLGEFENGWFLLAPRLEEGEPEEIKASELPKVGEAPKAAEEWFA